MPASSFPFPSSSQKTRYSSSVLESPFSRSCLPVCLNTDLSTSSTADGPRRLKSSTTPSRPSRDASTIRSALEPGFGRVAKVISVTTPRVPSEPTKSFGRSKTPSWTTFSSL